MRGVGGGGGVVGGEKSDGESGCVRGDEREVWMGELGEELSVEDCLVSRWLCGRGRGIIEEVGWGSGDCC